MLHTKRRYDCKKFTGSIEELAIQVWEYSWCLCTAFELGNLIVALDATSEDGAQEWAIFDKARRVQVESVTVSWMEREEWVEWLTKAAAKIETMEAMGGFLKIDANHGRCRLCA